MVKTFIQTVETQPWLRRSRQFLASTLIFSMLAMDVAKAMEDEKDSARISHTIPPILKYTGSNEPDSHSFNNYSSDSEDDSDKLLLGPTGLPSEQQKPEDQNAEVVHAIASQMPQIFYPISSSPFTLPTNVELSSVDSRSLENREQPLFTVSVNYPQLSSSLIHHPLEVDSTSDEKAPLLRDHHRQSNKAVSIKQHGNIIKLNLQRDTGVEDDISLEFVDLGYSSTPPSSHSRQQDSGAKTKKLEQKPLPSSDNSIKITERVPRSTSKAEQERQRLLRDLIGEEPSKSLFSDYRDARKSNTPPIFTNSLSPRNGSQILVVNERSSLLRSQPRIQRGDHDTDQSDDDEVSIEIGHPGNSDDPLHIAPLEEHPQYRSCCGCSSKRPFCHKHTEYTLPNLIQHLEEFSRLVALLRQGHTPQIGREEDSDSFNSSFEVDNSGGSSSPYNGSPPEANQAEDFLGDDSDEESNPADNLTTDTVHNLSNLNIRQENNRLDFLLSGAASSQLQLISIDQDLERAGISASRVASFWEFFELLPFNDKAKLKQFMHQIFDGKSAWKQRVGKWIVGPFIGIPLAYVMGTVYISSFDYILDNYHGKYVDFVDNLFGGNLSLLIINYITLSLLPDVISRNANLWKKGIGYLSNASIEKVRLLITAVAATFPSFIEPAYLIEAELRGIKYYNLHGIDNQFAITMMIFCPFLFIDSMASNMNILWATWPKIRENLGKVKSSLSRCFLREVIDFRPTPEDIIIREDFDKKLKNFSHFLFRASNDEIEAIYQRIIDIKRETEVSFSNENQDIIMAHQAILAVNQLLALGEEVIEGQKPPTSISEVGFDIFKKICVATGSPIRYLVLQVIFATMCELVFPDTSAQALGWGLATIGFPVQTALEWAGLNNAYEYFACKEDPQEHTSHSTARGHVNRFAVFQGLFLTLPLISYTLQVLNQWNLGNWWMFAAIPFFIAEFAAQAFSFSQTYNNQVATAAINGCHKLAKKCKGSPLCTACKRDWLIRFTQTSRADLEEWSPELIHTLNIISSTAHEKPEVTE